MRTLRTAAAGLALACAIAAPAHAQPRTGTFPTLRVGQSVSGTISETDPAFFEGGHFKVYQFQASPGRRYVATMESADFDTYITVARTVGGVTDHMLTDDDGGPEGTDSRLRFTVPEAGTYLLIAQALSEEGTGAFSVRLDTVTIRPPTVTPLTLGREITGELTEDDAEYDEQIEGATGFYDLYRFQGRAGQRVRARMEFEEYFVNVEVGRMEGGEFVPVEDFTEGANGVLNATLPETGEYVVRAGAFGSVTGEYTLRVEERAPAPEPRTTQIRRGETVNGELEDGDAELDDGRWYDAYVYTGRAGETIRIDLRAEDFDAYLVIGRMVDGEFQEIGSNDDAEDGEGLDSALEIELPEDGRYIIQATSFSAGSEGQYQLSVGEP
ncbi:MAG TPA: hypothetical protein VHG08_05205 [Longimicrobium sp.]|nr:hypothetical protein [Longimicrobium sp.]